MGFLDWLGVRSAATVLDSRAASRQVGVLSPFSTVQAQPPFVVQDIAKLWGSEVVLPLTRLEAMRIPSVAKARALLHSLIATRPIRSYRGVDLAPDQPTWTYRSDTGIDPARRMRDILDDHFFAEASLIAWKRSPETGAILDGIHVPYDIWNVDDDGQILINDRPVPAEAVCWIPGPWMGLLVHGASTLRAARDMDEAWMKRVRYPMPPLELHQVEADNMTAEEAKAFVVAAENALNGSGVFFTDHRIESKDHSGGTTDLFESGRNALRLDIANLLNIPAAMLEGSVAEASLTYSTQEGKRNELFDYTIPYWTAPIEQALSQDSVVPRGQRIRFDFTDLLTPATAPTGPTVED